MPFYSTKGIIINRYTPQKYLRSIFLKHIPKTALKVPIFALFSKGYVYCPLSTKGMKSFAMQKIKSNPHEKTMIVDWFYGLRDELNAQDFNVHELFRYESDLFVIEWSINN